MSFYINLMSKDKKKIIENNLTEEEKVNQKRYKKSEYKGDTREKDMTPEDYEKMYHNGYVSAGNKLVKYKCRLCGKTYDGAEASEAVYRQICSYCTKKQRKDKRLGVTL